MSESSNGAGAAGTPTLADITTIRIGGPIGEFVEPTTSKEFTQALSAADRAGKPLLVIGGGSNLLASDEPFDGVVIRDARHEVATDTRGSDVYLTADAGVNWDAFVALCVENGYGGVESLSGIPGTVGASVVQNIGAYGQEVATSVDSVLVWDRARMSLSRFDRGDLAFGYRTSSLKTSMYRDGGGHSRWFPTPRYVVLSVTYRLQRTRKAAVRTGQLAAALSVDKGARMDLKSIRAAVLHVRAKKDMLEDPVRYANPWMAPVRAGALDVSDGWFAAADSVDGPANHNRWSCGSFYVNPVVDPSIARRFLDEAPQFPATLPDGLAGIKTSAAWLIDHAGFHPGYAVEGAPADGAALSGVHTLALTNRGAARFTDIKALSEAIRAGVSGKYRVDLVPEPVIID